MPIQFLLFYIWPLLNCTARLRPVNWREIIKKFFFLFNFLWACYFFYFRNNSTFCDLSGHFSSAKFFSQGYFHAYNDNHFLGFVQDLFYPPLQDLIITFISFFTHKNFVQSGLIYTFILYTCYLLSITYLANAIKNTFVKIVFLVLVTLWLYLDKNTGIGLGLSLQDLLVTGLSGQFLGTIFFLILLRQVIENRNYLQISLLLALCFLGHVFVGLLAFATAIAYSLFNRKYLFSILLGAGLCAFSWLPFVVYSKYIVTYSIFDNNKLKLITLAVLCVFLGSTLLFTKKPKISILLLGAFLIFILNIIGEENYFYLPRFHYYRLIVYAYLFLWLEFCLWASQSKKWISVFVGMVVVIAFEYNGAKFIGVNDFLSFEVKGNVTLNDNEKYDRTYIVPNNNPVDQTFPQYLQSLPENNFKSAQGIYWGSSKTDYLASSYKTTLFTEHFNMIDFYWVKPFSCAVYACFLDQFLRDYNVGTFIVDPMLQSSSLPFFQRMCLQKNIIQRKTMENSFIKNAQLEINYPQIHKNFSMNIYKVQKNNQTVYNNNSPLEIIPRNARVNYYDPNKAFYFSDYFNKVKDSCEKKIEFNDLFLPTQYQGQKFSFHTQEENLEINNLQFKKLTVNKYHIYVAVKQPHWFKIKLSWLPGFQLIGMSGENLPLYQGIGYMLGYGQGNMNLVYEKPLLFYVSYLISILSTIYFIYSFLKRSGLLNINR